MSGEHGFLLFGGLTGLHEICEDDDDYTKALIVKDTEEFVRQCKVDRDKLQIEFDSVMKRCEKDSVTKAGQLASSLIAVKEIIVQYESELAMERLKTNALSSSVRRRQ